MRGALLGSSSRCPISLFPFPEVEPLLRADLLRGYGLVVAACIVLVMLFYRFMTSSRIPRGLKRAARFDSWADRLLAGDAILVGLLTPLALAVSLLLHFRPELLVGGEDPARTWSVTAAVALAGLTVASGWLAPDSWARFVTAALALLAALAWRPAHVEPRLITAVVPALGFAWFMLVYPFAKKCDSRRFRPAAFLGACLLGVVTTVPFLDFNDWPPDLPYLARPGH
jgi:hypothetical protein